MLIEDYACIGNCETMGLVGKNGSIDYLGFPRYESDACFAALLGAKENGRWLIAPQAEYPAVTRRYQQDTLVLETEFATPEGSVLLIDCMDRAAEHSDVLRLVRGVRGSVAMRMELIIRFGYGSVAPWVTRLTDGRLRAVVGPDSLLLQSDVALEGRDLTTVAEFTVREGEEIAFSLRYARSYVQIPPSPDVRKSIENVADSWRKWASRYKGHSKYREAVVRSLITLKALAHHATGGIAAAGTTSLPEEIGGSRNWDYRFCWLRDATFTLYALMGSGYVDEAKAWRAWLVRAVGGSPEKMQIMYTVLGDRHLTEYQVDWLPGYEKSLPVRIGNAASEQVQLDVYGEVIDMLYQARQTGLAHEEGSWSLEREMMEHLERIWNQPDEGIWEVRGGPKQFTHSKVMAWAAVDRSVRTMEEFQLEGPLDRWRRLRSEIHDDVCAHGYNEKLGSFVQFFGSDKLDASLLMLPLVGFLPPDDARIVGTVKAIEQRLLKGGFVMRYEPDQAVDGLKGAEGVFLACSLWLADNYVLQGRRDKAEEMFERVLSLRNDVGLLSEEYDPVRKRLLGNFPQAFSHVALVNSAHNLTANDGAAHHRSRRRSKHKQT